MEREEVFVYTYGGGGARWYCQGSVPSETKCLPEPPAFHNELVACNIVRYADRGLVLYCSTDDRSCCLIQGVDTGRMAGNVVVRNSYLLVGSTSSFSQYQKALASEFIKMAPVFGEDGPFKVPTLTDPVKRTSDGVKINWEQLFAGLCSSQKITDNAGESAVKKRSCADSKDGRALILGYLNSVREGVRGRLTLVILPRKVSTRKEGDIFELYGPEPQEETLSAPSPTTSPKDLSGPGVHAAKGVVQAAEGEQHERTAVVNDFLEKMYLNAKTSFEVDLAEALQTIWSTGELSAASEKAVTSAPSEYFKALTKALFHFALVTAAFEKSERLVRDKNESLVDLAWSKFKAITKLWPCI